MDNLFTVNFTLKFTGKQVRCPVVYVWWRDKQALYVGSSMQGPGRAFTISHEYLVEMQTSDLLEVSFYPDIKFREELLDIEYNLIETLKPELNKDRRRSKDFA